MTLFSNDTGAFPGNNVLGDDPEVGMNEMPWHLVQAIPRRKRGAGWPEEIMAGPAAGNIRGKMYRRKIRERFEVINPL